MDAIEKAKTMAKAHGMRWTQQRNRLITIMQSSEQRYVPISDVDNAMRIYYPGVSHNTIYRNLKEFQELGIVEIARRSGGMVVKLSCDPAYQHHHHFICQRCGRVQEIKMSADQLAYCEKQLPGAKITGHSFELYGICADCMQRMREKS
ncbi:metal uptake regulator [Limosilactobacillus secaliphilus]|uniref:Metal uptake regulator n=2 Tax=Limosilactobacillus secaliphilus TaxID=396268 RepID=A0A0R2I0M0_9LACO|nr:Fur family transcriptional regulator [Limosilactobacillus secaliphilus]KRN58395.1 metal uptake regulator [Limosilactobacillus secaliphilus]